MPAEAVVDLPRDQAGMFAQSSGHGPDDLLGVFPEEIVVHAAGSAGPGVECAAFAVPGQDLRVLLGQPNRRGGRRRAQHHVDAGLGEQIHGPAHPFEIETPLLRFEQAPGEFPHPNHVHPRLRHQLDVAAPAGFGIFGRTPVGKDPMLRIVIDTKIHGQAG
jgi:hypothetical protein